MEDESGILVNRIIEDPLSEAITIDKLRYATASDPKLSLVKEDILSNKYCRKELLQYKQIFEELSYINGVIMRGNSIVIPDSFQVDCIAIAHVAHQGASKTLSYLRESCWFPNMKKLADEYVETCIPCLASVSNTLPEPLRPNFLPDRPWQKLHANFKGPVGSKYCLHVLIDQFSKYPEVDIVSLTSFSNPEPQLDRILATHGVPDEITTGNGPPYLSDEMACYERWGLDIIQQHPWIHKAMDLRRTLSNQCANWFILTPVKAKTPRRRSSPFYYSTAPHPTLPQANLLQSFCVAIN